MTTPESGGLPEDYDLGAVVDPDSNVEPCDSCGAIATMFGSDDGRSWATCDHCWDKYGEPPHVLISLPELRRLREEVKSWRARLNEAVVEQLRIEFAKDAEIERLRSAKP